jgi:HEAT repeat protein
MNDRWREVVEAGHRGGADAIALVRGALGDDDVAVRELSLGALDRLGDLADHELVAALADPAPQVRRRAVELIAKRPSVDLLHALGDPDPIVVEHAAWACGEHEVVSDAVLERLIDLAGASDTALVREAAIAALGAIGDQRGLAAIIVGCADLPAVRRRAVLALAPFSGDEVEATIERALTDRDWQVRQAAEDLRRAAHG